MQRASADEDEYSEEAVHNKREERMPRLGMAARSILKSVPDNVLKALEQQQVEADAFNKQAKVWNASMLLTHNLPTHHTNYKQSNSHWYDDSMQPKTCST